MGLYHSIFDGKHLTNISREQDGSEIGVLYNYYGYMHPNGVWMIMREKLDGDVGVEYLFTLGKGDTEYAANWTDDDINSTGKALTYKRISQFTFKHV